MHAQLLRLFVTVTLLQIPDYLCEHFFVALGGRCVHLRYVRREFVRMPCFEAGFDGRGGFRDGLGFEAAAALLTLPALATLWARAAIFTSLCCWAWAGGCEDSSVPSGGV